MTSANLSEAFDYASKNPNSDFAKELQKALGSGVLDEEAKKYGIDTSVFKPKPQPQETGVVQGVAQAVAKPFLGFASQARDIARTAQGEQLQGQQEYDYGYLGKVKSFGQATPDMEGARAILRGAGAGAGVASNIGVGGAAKTVGTGILSRTAPKFIQLAGQGAMSGALAAGGQSVQDGQPVGDVVANTVSGALVGGVASPIIGGAASVAAKPITRAIDVASRPLETFKSDVLKNVNKALSIQGKKSIGQAVNVAPEKRFTAFETLYDLAPEIKVKDDLGQEVAFNPTEANFQQFGEALYKAKNNIWSKVDSALKQATQKGVEVDITPALDDINKLITDKGVPMDVKRQAQELSDEIASFVTEKGTAPIEALARFNTYLNKKITGQITGTSNNATREVEAITAKNLSQAVDDAIENLSGKEFAQLKDRYSSLKAIENDTVRRMQQELRMLDTGLADFMGQYGTADMISGVVALTQGNAAPLLRGVGTKVAANYLKSLRQPSKYLRDAFIQIDKFKKGEGIIPAVQELKKNTKLNRGSLSLNPEDWFEEVANSAEVGLKAKTKELQLDMAKEAARTMRNNGVSVEVPTSKNAVEILKQARDLARKKKVSDIIQAETPSDKMKPFLEPKKNELDLLKSLTPKQLERFNAGTKEEQKKALEYLKLKNDLETNDAIIAPKKKVADSLEQEAKGKTLEEFVKAQGTPVYHGTDKEFKIFDLSKVGSTQKLDKYGMFFTSDKNVAKTYSSLYPQKPKYNWTEQDKINANKAIIMEAIVKNDNPLTFKEVMDLAEKGKIKSKVKSEGFVRPSTYFDMNRDAIKEAMDITGKDVFEITKEGETFYMVNNPNKMFSKSQLTDIWNKANKK